MSSFRQQIDYARNFAYEAHGEQLYGHGPLPHTYHLEQVYRVMSNYYEQLFSSQGVLMLQSAYLHDVLEDTHITFEILLSYFGRDTARLVEAVTNIEKDHNGNKLNRKAKMYYTYPKIRASGRNAVGLKLADRIANVRQSLKASRSMFHMYKKEHEKFRIFLQIEGELQPMWEELQRLIDRNPS